MNNQRASNLVVGAYIVAIAGAFLIMFALVRFMQAYTRPQPANQQRVEERRKALAEMRAANAAVLHEYAWQDKTKGVVRVPIERAMQIVIEESGSSAARSNFVARVEKATAPPPKAPEKPNPYE